MIETRRKHFYYAEMINAFFFPSTYKFFKLIYKKHLYKKKKGISFFKVSMLLKDDFTKHVSVWLQASLKTAFEGNNSSVGAEIAPIVIRYGFHADILHKSTLTQVADSWLIVLVSFLFCWIRNGHRDEYREFYCTARRQNTTLVLFIYFFLLFFFLLSVQVQFYLLYFFPSFFKGKKRSLYCFSVRRHAFSPIGI